MSEGAKYPYAEALQWAECVVINLKPYCERIEIAGSVRREKDQVGDIEIVCIPKTISTGLFGDETERHPGFVAWVNKLESVKGKPTGKYTQRILGNGMHLDLFMATPDNWGLIFAIRTGSAEFSQKRLAARWVQLGYHSFNGMLIRHDDETVPVREESELFELLGIPWVEPKDRW